MAVRHPTPTNPTTRLGEAIRQYSTDLITHLGLTAVHQGAVQDAKPPYAILDVSHETSEPTINSGTRFEHYRFSVLLWSASYDEMLHKLERGQTLYAGSSQGAADRLARMADKHGLVIDYDGPQPGPMEPLDQEYGGEFAHRVQILYDAN